MAEKSSAPVAKPRSQTVAVPEEGYTSMTGLRSPSMSSGNIHRQLMQSDRHLSASTSFSPGHSSAGSQQSMGVGDMGSSRQTILTTFSNGDLRSPVDPSPYKVGDGSAGPAEPSYQNASTSERYVNPHPSAPPAQHSSPQRYNPGSSSGVALENKRSSTPDAPYYGETGHYSTIAAASKRTESVLYGTKTRRARRKSSRSLSEQDEGGIAGSRTLLVGILFILVLLCLASLGLSVYLLLTRSDCSSCSSGSTNDGGQVPQAVTQSQLSALETRINIVENTMAPAALSSDIAALNNSLVSQTASTQQRLMEDMTSIAGLQQTTASNLDLINQASANISALASSVQSNATAEALHNLQTSFSAGTLFQSCTRLDRTCSVTASVVNSEEACDIRVNPVIVPQGYVVTGVVCEVNTLNLISYMVRVTSGGMLGFACNCRFQGFMVARDEVALCTTSVFACRSSSSTSASP